MSSSDAFPATVTTWSADTGNSALYNGDIPGTSHIAVCVHCGLVTTKIESYGYNSGKEYCQESEDRRHAWEYHARLYINRES